MAQQSSKLPEPTPVQIVIVAYGAPLLLDRCIEGLCGKYPVIVVDNSSSAEVRDLTQRAGAEYLDPGANLGFAAGVNLALEVVPLQNTSVLLLNPDALIAPESIERMRSLLDSVPRVACVAPSQHPPASSRLDRVAWPFPTPIEAWINAVGLGALRRHRDFMIGSVLLVKGAALLDVGGFDERFFLYSEEIDWQLRARRKGWVSAYCPSADATHVGAGTDSLSDRRELRFHTGAEIYMRKHYGTSGWQIYRAGQLAGSLLRAAVLRGERARRATERAKIYWHGPSQLARRTGAVKTSMSRIPTFGSRGSGESRSSDVSRTRRPTPGPLVLDLRDLGLNGKGVGRVLQELATRLVRIDPVRYHVVATSAALPLLPDMDPRQVTLLPVHPQSLWEQLTLPTIATSLRAGAVYSHRECGAMWGPPLLLHVTEDPEVRWARQTDAGLKELARQRYARTFMNASLRRASVVTSTRATADELARFHGLPIDRVTVVPLGVDVERFHPQEVSETPDRGSRPWFFHLASSDQRDHSDVVIDAFANFIATRCDEGTKSVCRLIIAGDLGEQVGTLRSLVRMRGIGDQVEFPGRVSDELLAELYRGSIATIDASADEGFGLQPLEALACGSLLVSVGSAAVREVANGAEVIWSGLSVPELTAALAVAEGDPSRRMNAAKQNPGVAARYSWDVTAARLHRLLEQLAAERPA